MGDLNADLSGVKDEDMNREGGKWYVKPDGWYRVMVSESTVKPNKNGDGKVIHIKLLHLDTGESNDFEMHYINVQHPKEKVQEIGRAQLKELAIAVNHPNPNLVDDTSELLNKPFMVRLWAEPEDSKYSDADGMKQRIGGCASIEAYADMDDEPSSGSSRAGPARSSSPPLGDPPPPSDRDEIPF